MRKEIIQFSLISILAGCSANGQPTEQTGKSFQDIDVISIESARCVFAREGDQVRILVLPRSHMGDLRLVVVRLDLTQNHGKISVTCTREGFQEKSETVAFGPISYINDFAPCATGTDANNAEQDACKHQPLSSRSVTLQYPDTVRLILEPTAN